jgi:hypothetical protein
MSSQLQFWPENRSHDRLRWSVSRDKRLRDCARKYYFFHYASQGGKAAPTEALEHQLYVLKHLRNRFMWVGEVVHELLERTWHNWGRGQQVDPQTLIDQGLRRMRANYAASLQGLYRENPAHACGLIEHEYHEPVTRADWQELRARMERCILHFFAQPIVQEIREVPKWRWLALESMSSFSVDDATIIVKPDVAYRGDNGRVVLVDWKTGHPHAEDERLQLAVYGLFAERVWGLSNENVRAHLVYLDSGTVRSFDVTVAELREVEAEVRASVARMRALAGARSLGAERNPVAFTPTDDLQQCRRCAFRRICDRDALQA